MPLKINGDHPSWGRLMKPTVNLINDLFGCPLAELAPSGWARTVATISLLFVKSGFLTFRSL